jgi:hypothetical protein
LELDWAAGMGMARIIAANVLRMKKIEDMVCGLLVRVIPTRVRFQVKSLLWLALGVPVTKVHCPHSEVANIILRTAIRPVRNKELRNV